MKLAGQTIYTYIYISLVRSIHRIFEIVHSRVERVHTYRSFTRKKKQLPIDSTSDPFERSSSFSNEIFDHSLLHTFQTSPIQKLNRAFFPIFTSNVDAPFEINFEYPTSVRNRELKNNNKKKSNRNISRSTIDLSVTLNRWTVGEGGEKAIVNKIVFHLSLATCHYKRAWPRDTRVNRDELRRLFPRIYKPGQREGGRER